MTVSEFTPPVLPDAPSIGDDPLNYYTRVYALFLQGLFRQLPTGSYKWSDDEKLSEICITGEAPIPRTRIEHRPGIVIMRGPAQWANLSLDNMRTLDWKTGKKERTDLVACTMSMTCIAKFDIEATRIAWLIMRFIRSFKEMLQRYGHIHKIGDEAVLGPPSPPTNAVVAGEGDLEAMSLTVQSPFFFQWTETTEPLDAPQARELDAFMRTRLAPLDTTPMRERTVLRRPTIRGMPIGDREVPVSTPSDPITVKVEK